MNLLVLGDATSLHHRRMIQPFVRAENRLILAGFSPASIEGVETVALPREMAGFPGMRFWRKLELIRKIVVDSKIDLVHAHYITVYGLLSLGCGPVPKVHTAGPVR